MPGSRRIASLLAIGPLAMVRGASGRKVAEYEERRRGCQFDDNNAGSFRSLNVTSGTKASVGRSRCRMGMALKGLETMSTAVREIGVLGWTMASVADRAAKYREHATQLRRMAEDQPYGSGIRDSLLSLAEKFDDLVDSLGGRFVG
jgi:hypothetical protein